MTPERKNTWRSYINAPHGKTDARIARNIKAFKRYFLSLDVYITPPGFKVCFSTIFLNPPLSNVKIYLRFVSKRLCFGAAVTLAGVAASILFCNAGKFTAWRRYSHNHIASHH